MNILLAIPPSDNKKIIRMIDCSHEAKSDYLWHPNDFIIMSSLAGHGDKVFVVDATAYEYNREQFLEKCRSTQPDIAVFALSSVLWKSDFDCFNEFKAQFKNMPVYVLGDIFFEEEYRSFMVPLCDGVILNPYFIDFEKMKNRDVNGLQWIINSKDKPLIKNKKLEVISSNVPKHDLFISKRYGFPFAKHFKFATVTSVWGCPFSCAYCTDSQTMPVARKKDDIVKELEFLKKIKVHELFFADKVFGSNPQTQELLDAMKKDFHFSWSCYFHPSLYTRKLLTSMKKAGCHTIIVGIDSANIDALKSYNRSVNKDQLIELLNTANQLNISVCADFIIGLDHESKEDILATIDFALKMPLDFASFNIAAPLPGSSIRNKAKSENKMAFGEEGFDSLASNGTLSSSQLSTEELLALRHQAVMAFYTRPKYLLRRLARTTSFEHLNNQLKQAVELFRKN